MASIGPIRLLQDPRSLGSRLLSGLLPGLLPGLLKDTHNLRLKFRKFKREHNAPWVQYQIESMGKHLHMPPQSLAHAPLDAVAFMRLAQHLARRNPDARSGRQCCPGIRSSLSGQKPAHRCRLALAARGVGALIIGVLLQTRPGQCLPSAVALR